MRSEAARRLTERRTFLQTVAENLALGFANVQLREALHQQAIHDRLTGLYNRRYMEEVLERELRVAQRYARSLALVMTDIDHFKGLNDTYGHDAGDVVLKVVAGCIHGRVRTADVACRYGGEEILLILPDTALSAAAALAEDLRTRIRELALEACGQAIGPVTISLGVAEYPTHGRKSTDLLRAADAALYQAKQRGRDQVVAAQS